MGSVVEEEVSMKKTKKEKLFHLPEEIILDMISRLPFESVLHSRLVCKTWRNLVRDPSFAHMHLLRRHNHQLNYNDQNVTGMMGFIFLSESLSSEQGKNFHYLRYSYIEKNDKQHEHSHNQTLITTNSRIKLNPPVDNYLIVGSCNGLVCVSVNTKTCIGDPVFICNPFTREYVILPCMHIKTKDKLITGFGYHPSTNEYKVVRIFRSENQPQVTRVQVYTLGDCINGWRDKGEMVYELMYHRRFSSGILANGGALHWASLDWEANQMKIVAFDLFDEKFRVLPQPPFFSYNTNMTKYFELRVFRGSLCALHPVEGDCIDVWSFKKKKDDNEYEMNEHHEEYYKHWTWSKEFRLGQQILFSNNPVALTESGEVLLYHDRLSLYSHDVKTATSVKLVGIGMHSNLVPHMNSFISLKALGEKEVIESATEGTLESEMSKPRRSARLKRLRDGLL